MRGEFVCGLRRPLHRRRRPGVLRGAETRAQRQHQVEEEGKLRTGQEEGTVGDVVLQGQSGLQQLARRSGDTG